MGLLKKIAFETSLNKTYRFLLPCFNWYGDEFISKFIRTCKQVGLGDDVNPHIKGRYLFILCSKVVGLQNTLDFLNSVKSKDYYVTDYSVSPGHDFFMIVLEVPERFHNAYDKFIEGRYSEMYTPEEINVLFPKTGDSDARNILIKDPSCIDEFVVKLNQTYNTKLSEDDFFHEVIKEYELPLNRYEEVFNCNSEAWI